MSTAEPEELLRELKLHLGSERSGLREILDSLAEAVTIRDPHHHIIYANRAAVHSMGFASLEEMQRRAPHSIFADYIVEDERGRPLTMDDIPSVRLLAGEAPEPLVMRTTDRSTGAVRWLVLKTTPLCDPAGAPFAAVTVIEDTTRRADRRAARSLSVHRHRDADGVTRLPGDAAAGRAAGRSRDRRLVRGRPDRRRRRTAAAGRRAPGSRQARARHRAAAL